MKRPAMTFHQREGAFTLIELLIVVAIIAILAAIAVPNFLEAQVRAKVSRVKSDLRSFATALESYAVDHNNLPDDKRLYHVQYLPELSTPVAYMTSTMVIDPFRPPGDNLTQSTVWPDWQPTYQYVTYNYGWQKAFYPDWEKKGAILSSFGPDRIQSGIEHYAFLYHHPERGLAHIINYSAPAYIQLVYDPTNGTRSNGDIGRAVGELGCEAQIGG